MRLFQSYRSQLRTLFLLLALSAIALTGWEALLSSSNALQQATTDRLSAICQTRSRQLERYFQDLGSHVLALSSDESVLRALADFSAAWATLPPLPSPSPEVSALRDYYRSFGPAAPDWFPAADPRTLQLQHLFLSSNPHPIGAKDRLLTVPGPYGALHARYHPTLHRYQTAFGIYDIFLIDAAEARVLYTVFKEIDLGVQLRSAPYRDSALGDIFRRAMELSEPEQFILRDYTPYLPSHSAPAAFIAAPIWRAGEKIGVLVMQISIREINRVMTADANWAAEGLGRTGQAYVVGPDRLLRSDLRLRIEDPDRYHAELLRQGTPPAVVEEIRRYGSAVLRVPPPTPAAVLHAQVQPQIPGLSWTVVAEIAESEAFASVRELRNRILGLGVLIALVFWLVAEWLARSVTRPVQALSAGAQRLGLRDFSTRLPIDSDNEFGRLAASFNRMAEDLERTTVSKEELEVLAGRLITSQEDERRRLARELHDHLSQRLAAVAIEAGQLEKTPEADTAAWRAGLERIKRHMAALSDDIHGLSRRLHPAMLDDLGLSAALESECRAFFERGGPPVELSLDGHFDTLSKDHQLAIYRIVQEALRNIQKHADAELIHVSLRHHGQDLLLRIHDDGRGFDRSHPSWRAGLGLASMEERARLLHGHFEVSSSPGAGTRIEVTFPLA